MSRFVLSGIFLGNNDADLSDIHFRHLITRKRSRYTVPVRLIGGLGISQAPIFSTYALCAPRGFDSSGHQ
jgi:hypothetical protein